MAREVQARFEAIEYQFDTSVKEVIELMWRNLKTSSFKRLRKRGHSAIISKLQDKRNPVISRPSLNFGSIAGNNSLFNPEF